MSKRDGKSHLRGWDDDPRWMDADERRAALESRFRPSEDPQLARARKIERSLQANKKQKEDAEHSEWVELRERLRDEEARLLSALTGFEDNRAKASRARLGEVQQELIETALPPADRRLQARMQHDAEEQRRKEESRARDREHEEFLRKESLKMRLEREAEARENASHLREEVGQLLIDGLRNYAQNPGFETANELWEVAWVARRCLGDDAARQIWMETVKREGLKDIPKHSELRRRWWRRWYG